MKIRTDFVTNSSSYNSAEIVIDNFVLLKILMKYKNLGLFKDNDPFFGVGSFDSVDILFEETKLDGFLDSWSEQFELTYDKLTITPAFYYFEKNEEGDSPIVLGLEYDIPDSLCEVLERIIKIIEGGIEYLDSYLVLEMIKELRQRRNEINLGFSSVSWKNLWTGDYPSYDIFIFDLENGEKILHWPGEDE